MMIKTERGQSGLKKSAGQWCRPQRGRDSLVDVCVMAGASIKNGKGSTDKALHTKYRLNVRQSLSTVLLLASSAVDREDYRRARKFFQEAGGLLCTWHDSFGGAGQERGAGQESAPSSPSPAESARTPKPAAPSWRSSLEPSRMSSSSAGPQTVPTSKEEMDYRVKVVQRERKDQKKADRRRAAEEDYDYDKQRESKMAAEAEKAVALLADEEAAAKAAAEVARIAAVAAETTERENVAMRSFDLEAFFAESVRLVGFDDAVRSMEENMGAKLTDGHRKMMEVLGKRMRFVEVKQGRDGAQHPTAAVQNSLAAPYHTLDTSSYLAREERERAAAAVRFAGFVEQAEVSDVSDGSFDVSDDEQAEWRQDVTVAGTSRGQRRCLISLQQGLCARVRLKLPKWSPEAANELATHFPDIDDKNHLRRLLNENVLFDAQLQLARERWHSKNQGLSPKGTGGKADG